MARNFKAQGRKLLRDKQRKITKHVTVAWAEVHHPEFAQHALVLLIVRDRTSLQPPMYLLSSVAVQTVHQAWELVHAYMHRWQIEQTFRVGEAELGMKSPRLWFWDNRLKLLGLVSLVYDFLLSLLRNWPSWVPVFLKQWASRTGNRHRNVSVPIYRLRLALANALMITFAITQNSG